jgi:hypothetical protein
MDVFFFILINNIAPIFFIIGLGYVLEKTFELDIYSFSKVNFYVFVPALVLVKVYQTEIQLDLMRAIGYAFVFLAAMTLLAVLIAKIRGYEMSKESAFKNSVMFYNSGNFGIPLITLVFAGTEYAAYAVSIQIMVLMVQNLTTNSIGFYNAGRGQMNVKNTIIATAKMPSLSAVIIALSLKLIPFNMADFFLWPAFEYMHDGLISVALLTLGIQLSLAKLELKNMDVYLASFSRLIGGPLVAFILIHLLGIGGVMARVLFISSAVPSAVNTALIAVEFNNEPDFASQVVLTTTLLSAVTLTAVIYLSGILF